MIPNRKLVGPLPQSLQRVFHFIASHKKSLILSIGSLLSVVIIAQLIYGATEKALPFTKIDGVGVSGWSSGDVEKYIQKHYSELPLTIDVDAQKVTSPLSEAGVTPNFDFVTKNVSSYPLWLRFIPFSIFKEAGADTRVHVQIDSPKFYEFAKRIVPLCTITPSDASVSLTEGKLTLIDAKKGRSCSKESLKKSLSGTFIVRESGIRQSAAFTDVEPRVSTQTARSLMTQAEEIINHELEIQLLGTVSRPDPGTIALWLSFDFESDASKPSIAINETVVSNFLKSVESKIYIAPGKTIVQTLDGVETGKVIGVNGRGIHLEKSLLALEKALLSGGGAVVLEPAPLAPTIEYNRQYTQTNAGLEALLKDIVKRKGNYSISLRQLDGPKLTASAYSKKEVYTTASTYKMYVAYAVLKRIDSGQMKWTDQATSGRTVEKCFEVMIVQSDNPCAEWLGEKIGWKVITSMLHRIGLSKQTSLYSTNGFVSTANDEALFLQKLQQNELSTPELTTKLLDLMKRQVYRSGIPAGVNGVVANKVGFLNGLLHDASIVTTPNGVYILVILSDGSSWREIADAARQIHNFLY